MKKLLYIFLFATNIVMSANHTPHDDQIMDIEQFYSEQSHHIIANHSAQTSNPEAIADTYTNLRALGAPVPPPSSTWTQPLIIDNNNPAFNNTSVYQFQSNIVYNPGIRYTYPTTYTDYPAAIIVAKDNMTIDLNGFNLSLDPSSSPNFLTNSPTYGIAVYQGVKNLKIISSTAVNRKGSITGFSGYAIYAAGIIQNYNSYDINSNYIKNLVIDNLLITQNINGIYVLNAIQATISNTHLIYNFSPRALFAINFYNVLNGIIESCRINQNYTFSHVIGINLTNTVNGQVQSCQITANRSMQNGNSTGIKVAAVGSGLLLSTANSIENCDINRNTCSYTASRESIGIDLTAGSIHNIIENCSCALHGPIPSASPPPTPAIIGIGIRLDGSDFNQINSNRCGYNSTYGISDTNRASTSFFTRNFCALNLIANYNVMVPNPPGPTIPLPTIILSSGDLNGYTGAGPILSNLETSIPS